MAQILQWLWYDALLVVEGTVARRHYDDSLDARVEDNAQQEWTAERAVVGKIRQEIAQISALRDRLTSSTERWTRQGHNSELLMVLYEDWLASGRRPRIGLSDAFSWNSVFGNAISAMTKLPASYRAAEVVAMCISDVTTSGDGKESPGISNTTLMKKAYQTQVALMSQTAAVVESGVTLSSTRMRKYIWSPLTANDGNRQQKRPAKTRRSGGSRARKRQ